MKMKFSTVYIYKCIMFLLFLSQSMFIPFFPLYLKYLNFTILQMGIIRAFMMWIPLLFIPLSTMIINKISSSLTRRVCISVSIFTAITTCICFIFVSPIQNPNSVTHCSNTSHLFVEKAYFEEYSNLQSKNVSEKSNETTPKFYVKEDNLSNMLTANEKMKNILKYSSASSYESAGYETTSFPLNYEEITNDNSEDLKKESPYFQSTEYFATKQNPASISKYVSSIRSQQKSNLTDNHTEMKTKGDDRLSFLKSPFSSSIFQHKNQRKSLHHMKDKMKASMDNTQVITQNKDSQLLYNNIYSKRGQYIENMSPNTGDEYQDYSQKLSWRKLNNDFHDSNADDIVNDNSLELSKNSNEFLYHDLSSDSEKSSDFSSFIHKRENENHIQHEKTQKNVINSSYVSENNVGNDNTTNKFHMFESLQKIQTHEVWFHKEFISETFLTVLAISALYEILFSHSISWIDILHYYNMDEYSYEQLFHMKVFMFKSLGLILSYPIASVLATLAPCPYQIAMHPFLGAVILVIAFLAALLLLYLQCPEIKYFRSRKPSKPSMTENHSRESTTYRFLSSMTTMLIGISVASQSEFILWRVEHLTGFPFNYEYLYCSYFVMNTLSCAVTDKYLQYKKDKQEDSFDEEDTEEEESIVHFSYEWFMDSKKVIYTEHQKTNILIILGTLFLSITLFLTSFMINAWFLLLVGLLKGIADAVLESAIPQGSWTMVVFGYGLGCFIGSIISSFLGINFILYSSSACMLTCFVSWGIYSSLYWTFYNPYSKEKEKIQTPYPYFSI